MVNRFRDGDMSPVSIAFDACMRLHSLGYPLTENKHAQKSPVLFCFTPVARMNPFQRLLYTAAWENGFTTVPIYELDDVEAFTWPGHMVLHLHWLNQVLSPALSDHSARIRLNDYVDQLKRVQDLGYKTIWTIHNGLPHNSMRIDMECELRQKVSDHVDFIHIMNMQTVDSVASLYTIDQKKLIYQPHPSYVGSYPSFVSSDEARHELGLSSDDFVVTLFGSIQRYKGILEFIRMVDELKQDPQFDKIKVLVAGLPSDEQLVAELRETYGHRRDIILHPAKIPDEMVQYYMKSSNVVACPYIRTLNSGVGLLALSFGRPFIAPNIGAFRELIDNKPEFGWLYEAGEPDGLKRAIAAAFKQPAQPSEDAMLRLLDNQNPSTISGLFFREIRARL